MRQLQKNYYLNNLDNYFLRASGKKCKATHKATLKLIKGLAL